ncbi:MAG TPA: plasmid pRiA4b ORF-3 family protein [Aldersonia sp.]
MTAVSRRRKTKKRAPQPRNPVLIDPPEPPCTCPSCTGVEADPAVVIDALLEIARDLALAADPLDAELVGSSILSFRRIAGSAFDEGLVSRVIPAVEQRASATALAMVLALGSVGGDKVAPIAFAAADRIVAGGVQPPRWADELRAPVTSGNHRRLTVSEAATSFLACEFHRGRRSHALLIRVDDAECGAAGDIALLDEAGLQEAFDLIDEDVRMHGGEFTIEELDAAEFRWQVENALDVREDHDEELGERDAIDDLFAMFDADEDDDDDRDPAEFHTMRLLLRTRLDALPKSPKPPAPHEDFDARRLPSIEELMQLLGADGSAFERALETIGQRPAPKLPPKRKKADGPAPVYQIKVNLVGAKPPIWRRLEVPAGITLAKLHDVIQIAFGWEGYHMHAFETRYGTFGVPDPELGHKSEKPVALEQVADGEKAKIRYTYDFGDGWDHDIVVEKVLDREPKTRYPRCTAGRRATPPEDCGGIGGYEELVEILADPAHPEHEDKLEWLGLESGAEFDPARFDAGEVNEVLAGFR